jgi:hypothetical protein
LVQLSEDGPPEPVVCVFAKTCFDFLERERIRPSNLDVWMKAGWIEDLYVEIPSVRARVLSDDSTLPGPVRRLKLPPGRHRLVGIRKTVFDAPTEPSTQLSLEPATERPLDPQCEPAPTSEGKKPQPAKKRSTVNDEAKAKLIAALTKHHQYADGGSLNLEPIGNNELARQAKVSKSTVSDFFRKKFKGYTKYKALCRDAYRLTMALRMLNDEFAPYHLLGDAARDVATPEED